MKNKIWGVLLVLFTFMVCVSSSFGQDEATVMKRYDFSSPKATFESLKKAIKEKDVDGILIHNWNIVKALSGDKNVFQSFEDFCNKIKTQYSDNSIIESIEEWYDNNGSWLKLTETDFLKESEREHYDEGKIGATTCFITVQQKKDGKQLELQAVNIDGASEWWIFNYPGGE